MTVIILEFNRRSSFTLVLILSYVLWLYCIENKVSYVLKLV